MNAERHQERLSSGPHPLIQELFGRPGIAAALPMLGAHLAAHRAHAVMLIETEIISPKDGCALLNVLDQLESEGPSGIQLRPELNDLFTCTEMRLIELLGEEVGGRLHTGRSRNDFAMTVARLALRTKLLDLYEAVVALCQTVLDRSAEHTATIFPGYTHHSQQAQPVTFGHFLLGHYDAFVRDLERLSAAYERTNSSPLGGAAMAGTGFPIDRDRTAELLGFERLVEHTADASGGRDFELEAASVATIASANMDRLAESLIGFTSFEFGYVELADEAASVSSIMPQKKNPVALEMVEGLHARAIGRLAAMLTILKSTTLGMSRETVYCEGELHDCVAAATGAAQLLDLVIAGLQVNAERALVSVAQGMSTTTELADTLVRHYGLSFHQAHRVVGRAVADALANNAALSVNGVESAARDVLGRTLGLDDRTLAQALDPAASVAIRGTRGGPATAEVERMISTRQRSIANARAWLEAKHAALTKSEEQLRLAVARLRDSERVTA